MNKYQDDVDYYSKLSADPSSVGVSKKNILDRIWDKMRGSINDVAPNQTTSAANVVQGAQQVSQSQSAGEGIVNGITTGATIGGPAGAVMGGVLGGVVGGIRGKQAAKEAKALAEAEGLQATQKIESDRNYLQTQLLNSLANNLSQTLLRR